MSNLNTYWHSVVDALRDHEFRFRIKWTGANDVTAWQPWVISPTAGYLETGGLGPVPVREVEWLDVSRFDRNDEDKNEQISRLLTEIDAKFIVTVESIQITSNIPSDCKR